MRLAAALIALSAAVGAAPASAQLCGAELSRHPALVQVALRGGTWVGAGTGQVPTLRFRLNAGCVEVQAPGWDWMTLIESDVEGSYEGTVYRRKENRQLEIVNLRFRLAGGSGVDWIEYEVAHLSAADRLPGGTSHVTTGTLFHRP